ncbi:MAG: hypothetical protein ACKVZJ_00895 [Phycisphaerales bacterium]
METRLKLDILPQPDGTACGPTCLHSVYRYYGDDIPLAKVVRESARLRWGGTLAVMLACHALRRGYRAVIHTYNLEVFDPTWFTPEADPVVLKQKLRARLRAKEGKRLKAEIKAYLDFIDLGGHIQFDDLTPELIVSHLRDGKPVLTGLSSTYLYRTPREYGPRFEDDDVRGDPSGHFVVLFGHNPETNTVRVADPLEPNPPFDSHTYEVGMDRLICSILLGILTYDANLLVIEPGPDSAAAGGEAPRPASTARRTPARTRSSHPRPARKKTTKRKT